MYIKNSKKILERIQDYQSIRQLDHMIGLLISAPVSVDQIYFESPVFVDDYADKFRNSMRDKGVLYSQDESTIAAMIMSVLEETAGGTEEFPPPILDAIIRGSKVFHKGELEENPYFKNIHFEKQQKGNFVLKRNFYRRYELAMYNTPAPYLPGVMIPAVCTFDYKFRYPCICENDSTWMSITPNEIYTMEQPIREAAGNVLTLGCGMGYFAYMASEKEDVSHVTIIEKSPDVMELFTTFLLPQFPHKEKITIIEADAFEYMKDLEDGAFDYCFADIWIGNLDAVPYFQMKQLCKRFRKMQMAYWIEDAIVASNIGLINLLLLDHVNKENNIQSPSLDLLPEENKFVYSLFQDLLKDVRIETPEDLDCYMNYKNIIKLMS